MSSELRPSWNITVLDNSANPAKYDPARSFLYLLDSRGQDWTDDNIPDVAPVAVKDIGVASDDFRLSVMELGFAKQPVSLPIVDKKRRTPYWIQRGHFVKYLSTLLPPSVNTNFGVETKSLIYDDVKDCYVVEVEKEGKKIKYDADLLIGADGIHSQVRSTLFADGGKCRVLKSPAGGLHFKALQLKNNFSAYNATFSTNLEMAYAVRSSKSGYSTKLGLGILPVLPSVSERLGVEVATTRPASVITRTDHDIANAKTASEVESIFKSSFPQLRWEEGEVVEKGEWQRFAESKPVWFPHPQHSKTLTKVSPKGGSGVILLGDAAHSFPPDIGQGVNAALVDVHVLSCCIEEGGEDGLGSTLNAYEKKRMPEVRALTRLCQIANPYQYSQTGRIAGLRKKLWAVNFLFRLLLHKVSRGLLSANSFYSMQSEKSYIKILRRCNNVTRFLWATVGLMVWKIWKVVGAV